MKWNRNAKTTQIKVNDRGTKIENAENLKPTENAPNSLENIRKSPRNSRIHPKTSILNEISLK